MAWLYSKCVRSSAMRSSAFVPVALIKDIRWPCTVVTRHTEQPSDHFSGAPPGSFGAVSTTGRLCCDAFVMHSITNSSCSKTRAMLKMRSFNTAVARSCLS